MIAKMTEFPADGQPLEYDLAKALARHPDPGFRRRLARRADVPAEILYYLADDPDPGVRREVACNPQTPALAQLVLAEDADTAIRCDLAARVVKVAPGLSSGEQDRARQATYRVLERLVRDQIPHVRQIMAEALKDVADAPPELINHLARDAEEAVATPILQFSPALTDEDLLDIVSDRPSSAALVAISRRGRVAADVSDAISATDDSGAIAALLNNPSAQIREETLDRLIDRAEGRCEWHEPLVRRPGLTTRAAGRLAHFVADRLLNVLIQRQDLSPECIAEVKRVVHRRLEETGQSSAQPSPPADPTAHWMETARKQEAPASLAEAVIEAKALQDRRQLTEAMLLQALKNGNPLLVIAGIAILGELSVSVVNAAIEAASPRGITAMVWKAGLTPIFAIQAQSRLSGVAPSSILFAADNLGYALTPSEMEWQIEMFTEIAEEETVRASYST